MFGREKFVIRPGKVCSLDPVVNRAGLTDNDPLYVTVKKLVKWRPFGRSTWEVEYTNIDGKISTFSCSERALAPEGMSFIRYPGDSPYFSAKDSKVLGDLIDMMNRVITLASIDNYFHEMGIKDEYLKSVKEYLESIKIKVDVYLSMKGEGEDNNGSTEEK